MQFSTIIHKLKTEGATDSNLFEARKLRLESLRYIIDLRDTAINRKLTKREGHELRVHVLRLEKLAGFVSMGLALYESNDLQHKAKNA